MSNWAQLSNGMRYDYDKGAIDGDFTVHHLARTLSRMPRYNSWTDTDWSIASHECLVAEIIATVGHQRQLILGGLHHDAHECLTGDLIRPFMGSLSEDAQASIRSAKRKAQAAIEVKLGIRREVNMAAVHHADIAALEAERRVLFGHRMKWPTENYVDPKLLEIGIRIMESDLRKFPWGEPAAALFVQRHTILMEGR